MNIILIGIQGSGKGTQAKMLSDKFGWSHITTGDLFRENIKNNTELGKIAISYTDKGELVPDKYVFEIVEDALSKAENGFILDGFPRNMEQAEFLNNKFKIDRVLLLDLSDEISMKRTLARRNCIDCKRDYNILFKKPKNKDVCDACGGQLVQRKDDNEEAIKKRLEKFHSETEKVIDYFREKDILISINADQNLQDIQAEIITKLGCQ